jgi:pyrroline-5-carboxylate reductase
MSGFPTLLIFGAGKMGGAMLEGALKAGWPASRIGVIETHVSEHLAALHAAHGFALNPANGFAAEMVLLAIKPQMLDAASAAIRAAVTPDSVIISIMAGKSIADFVARLPGVTKFVRTMPNTPAAIGRGITGAFATAAISADERAAVNQLLATTGKVVWVDSESQIDAVTAVSGSGPAYVFHMVECLAKAGEDLGLAPDLAMKLARATIEGAGELLYQSAEVSAEQLRKNVTSPGGTTAAALEHLMAEDGLAPLMRRAVMAAEARAKALAG